VVGAGSKAAADGSVVDGGGASEDADPVEEGLELLQPPSKVSARIKDRIMDICFFMCILLCY